MSNRRPPRSKTSDYLDTLATALRELGGPTTIPHELAQNADDGSASNIRFSVTPEELIVWNDGEFTDCRNDNGDDCPWPQSCDLHAFGKFQGQTKATDPTKTGAFGVGFTSVYRVTDRPELLYDNDHWVIDEMASATDRLSPCSEDCARTHGQSGTTFILPWARTASSLRQKLKVPPVDEAIIAELEAALLGAAPTTLLFLQHIKKFEIETSRGRLAWERLETGDEIVVSHESSSARWLSVHADFAEHAHGLVARAAGLINPESSTKVTIALPIERPISSGVLYATLPTRTASGLPAHVNASFFAKTDRKSVRFETSGFDTEWNLAAIAAAAHGLADNAADIAEKIGIEAFWQFLGGITDLDRGAGARPNHSGTYLDALIEVVPDLPVVETIDGRNATPRRSLLPREQDLYKSASALAKLDLPIVAQTLHGRLHTNTVYTSYEISLLTGRHIIEGLVSIGATEPFDPTIDGILDRDDMLQVLDALDGVAGKVANLDEIDEVAIVPCRNDMFAPAAEVVWPASDDDAALFEVLVDDLLVADVETTTAHCSGLEELCRPLDAARASELLQGVEIDDLDALAEELLGWLSRNVTPHTDEATVQRLADLPIYPTAKGLKPLTELSMPNEFHDPIGIASLVSDAAARDFRVLLTHLGARPLDIVDYIRLHAIPAAQAHRISTEQAVELIKLITRHQEALADLRDSIAQIDLVPCLDGQLHAATEVHMPSEEIAALAPEMPVAQTMGLQSPILEWLGVQRRPSDTALSVAVQRLADETDPDPTVAEVVLRTLHGREDLPDSPPEFLVAQPWLPLRRGGRARPSEVLPTNARNLYGEQGNELGLHPRAQIRYFALLEWVGMPPSPLLATVVAHLRHCVETQTEVSPEVYRVLSDNTEQSLVRQLAGTACIQVGPGHFVEPTRVFWRPPPFARWCWTMPADAGHQGRYRPFFELAGVKEEPGPAEIAVILQAIHREFGTDRVDDQAEAAIHACWAWLTQLLDEPDASAVLLELGRERTALDPRGILARPDQLFFADSRALHQRFPLLAQNVISRVHGTWPALDRAGVRRVDELIKARLVDVQADIDTELPHKIADRVSALRRVLDDEIVDELLGLSILRTPDLRVVYRAELFGHPYEIDPEPVDAIYISEQDELVYTDRASVRALARELSRAIAPDEDPGPLAMKLEPILSAQSADKAHDALNEFGIAELDVTELEPAWSPTADPGQLSGESGDITDESPGPHESLAPTGSDGASDDSGDGENAVETTTSPGGESEGNSEGGASGGPGRPGRARDVRRRRTTARDTRQCRLRSYVVEADEDEGDRGTVGDEAPYRSPIDVAGVDRVLAFEDMCGRDAKEKPHDNPGFDVESYDKSGTLERRIEIKSTGGKWDVAGVMLSKRQHQQALTDGDLFWLYVVENALDDDYRIYRIQNPANRIDYFGFDGGWKAIAEPDLERDSSGKSLTLSSRRLGWSAGQE